MTSHTEVFRDYARSYPALYHDKNYEAECDFLEHTWQRFSLRPVKRVLDLGCGAGGHVFPLASRGYEVTGVDRSPAMLDLAKERARLPLAKAPRLELADIQTLRLGEAFDAVVCMFAVLSYQTSNEALLSTLRTARHHLAAGASFVCDFWYGPAVLKQQPADRIKEVRDGDDRVVRLASPSIDTEAHVVTVDYRVLRLHGSTLVEETRESHRMRYFFKPEIELLMQLAGFELRHFCPFGQLGQPVSQESWNVSAIGLAIWGRVIHATRNRRQRPAEQRRYFPVHAFDTFGIARLGLLSQIRRLVVEGRSKFLEPVRRPTLADGIDGSGDRNPAAGDSVEA